jgi:iron(III) transport system substrate-binding protein
MNLTRRYLLALATLGAPLAGGAAAAPAKPPQGYPRSYRGVIEAAVKERTLTVYGNADAASLAGLLADFRSIYPQLRVAYRDLGATPLYRRVLDETARGAPGADLVWSSAMDLQAKLINDGYAQAYASPEKPNLPPWAVWRNEGWGVTAEPIVFAYNKRLTPPRDVPASHEAFERLLRTKANAYRGKIATYDPAQSGVGFLYLSEDVRVSRDTWKLVRGLGAARTKLYASTGEMIDGLVRGEHLILYNAIGSYVLERAKKASDIGVIFPADYTQVMSRIAFIAKEARSPNAARLFLDYMLSLRGQRLLAHRSLGPVRVDMPISGVPQPRADLVQAIRVGPSLLANLDQIKRARFFRDWNDALAGV